MKKIPLALPEIGLIAATRGMLGAGLGLLVADKVPKERRSRIGRALLAIGLVTTVPLVLDVLSKRNPRED